MSDGPLAERRQELGWRSARSWGIGLGAALLLLLSHGSLFLLARGVGNAPGEEHHERFLTTITSEVQMRTISDEVVFRGDVVASGSRSLVARAHEGGSDSLVVTRADLSAGSEVKEGDVALALSGRPVIVLQGILPAYRTLRVGDEGPDVGQLQEALARLNLIDDAGTDGVFGPSTAQAVADLYARSGFEPARAPEFDEAEEQSAEFDVRDAERALELAILERSDAASQADATAASRRRVQLAVESARAALVRAESRLETILRRSAPILPVSEILFVPRLPALVAESEVELGRVIDAGKSAMTLSNGDLELRVQVPSADAAMLEDEHPVTVLGQSTGDQYPAVVTDVGQPNDEGKVPLRVVPAHPLPSQLLGANLAVRAQFVRSEGKVPAVPVAAVRSTPGKGDTVVLVGRDGAQRHVEVDLGPTGGGYVQVAPRNGDELSPGQDVVLGTSIGTGGTTSVQE